MSYNDETLALRDLLAQRRHLSRVARKALIERLDELLWDTSYLVRNSYYRLARYLMQWAALPSQRCEDWRLAVRQARNDITLVIADGGRLGQYAQGLGPWHGHTIDPGRFHESALESFKSLYTSDLQKCLDAVPHPLPLAVLMTMPLPIEDLPSHERCYHADH